MRSSQSLLLLLVTLTANHPSIQAYPQSKTTTTQSLASPTPTTTAKAIEASRTENSTREVAVVTTEAAKSNSSMNEDSGKDSDNKPGWDEQDDDEDYSDQFNWECGTDYFTKLVSESTVDRDCPELKVIINSCCLAHDDCYDKQLGRTFCDDTFCACLDNVTKPSAVCSKEDSPTFCELVRHFGEAPYNASATTPATTSTTAKTTIDEQCNTTVHSQTEPMRSTTHPVTRPSPKKVVISATTKQQSSRRTATQKPKQSHQTIASTMVKISTQKPQQSAHSTRPTPKLLRSTTTIKP